jgi:hypothetical protein
MLRDYTQGFNMTQQSPERALTRDSGGMDGGESEGALAQQREEHCAELVRGAPARRPGGGGGEGGETVGDLGGARGGCRGGGEAGGGQGECGNSQRL